MRLCSWCAPRENPQGLVRMPDVPTHKWSGPEAKENLFGNPLAFWAHREFAGRAYQPAYERLAGDLFTPGITPGFRIKQTDPIFAIGSCFARALEDCLRPRGFQVESYRDEDCLEFADQIRKDVRHTTDGPVVEIGYREITNKYNVFAVLQHLRWVFEEEVPPLTTFLPLGDGLVQDPHSCPVFLPADAATTLRRREAMTPVLRRLRDCKLLVVTLGLTEVWFDQQTGLYLNFAPDRAAIKLDPSRFSCLATSFQENRDGLEQIYLLAKRVAPEIKMLVTVSPVALTATFRPVDVVVANTASKSTLRAVADDFVASHADVDYFPSYELVQHSNQNVVRKADRSHVTVETSRAIIDLFARHYVENV